MTSAPTKPDLDSKSAAAPQLNLALEDTHWFDRLCERFSQGCSSILVKETRQALKSKQFLWTYFGLLACVGIWSVLGISFARAGFDDDAGRDLLQGFWLILGFPLALIIPYSAYRSLAREYEDGTIDLISITTMKPHQIVIGKLGSALLQMMIYLSILAPCILLTYMLRGIGLEQILVGLFACVGCSVCLTILGLFLAGLVRSRALSVGVSVLFALFLGWLYFIWSYMAWEMTYRSNLNFRDDEFGPILFGFTSTLGSTAALLLVTAAALISFPADNRSTRIRVMMLVQQTLFFALAVVIFQVVPYEDELFLAFFFISAHYWLIMGFMMMGESPRVSRRVQRSLPRSMFSRSLFSFLMPGPGRGFLFALSMVWGCGLMLGLMIVFHQQLVMSDSSLAQWQSSNWRRTTVVDSISAIAVGSFYVSSILSTSYLLAILVLHRSRSQWAVGLGPMINLVLGGAIVAMPTLLASIWYFNTAGYGQRGQYTGSQVFNWYWTVVEVWEGQLSGYWLMFALFAFLACPVILIAIALASRELLQRPIPIPQRVAIDQQKAEPKLPVGESIDEIFGEIG